MLIIRKERETDYNEVYQLISTSFATNPDDEGDTADYLNAVRKKETFIPELSMVAENGDGKIVGQIVLYKITINAPGKISTGLVLSPICVHPDYFRRGIASAMMRKTFVAAENMGYSCVFLCGNPDFYNKFGFLPTHRFGIYHVKDDTKKAEWCMVRELFEGALCGINGTIDIQ